MSPVSPFLPPDTPAAVAGSAASQGAPIEFRGVVVIGGRQRFNFFDPARKQSAWVGLAEPGMPYRVTAYDTARERVTVAVGGRVLELALEKTKIASSPPPANVPVVGVAPATPAAAAAPGVAPVVLNPTPADEAKRLEAIAAEVRRRRAQRQQQAGMTPAPGAVVAPAEKTN